MKALIFDCETTMRDENPRKFSASPHYHDNRILVMHRKWYDKGFLPPVYTFNTGVIEVMLEYPVWVAHNAAFDIHYILKEMTQVQKQKFYSKVFVWDTQIAEYILSAQDTKKSYSLDALAESVGLEKGTTLKDDDGRVINTEEIPIDDLSEYCQQDVTITEALFKRQLEAFTGEAPSGKIFKRIAKARKGTIMMEANGINVDIKRTTAYLSKMAAAMDAAAVDWRKFLASHGDPKFREWLAGEPTKKVMNSRKILESLFKPVKGEMFKFKLLEPVLTEHGVPVIYKSGKRIGDVKYKLHEYSTDLSNLSSSVVRAGDSIDEEYLKKQASKLREINYLLHYKKATKMYNTYLLNITNKGYLGDDGSLEIHCNYNHTVTPTGRLSSSNPNMQNISDVSIGEVNAKKIFKPHDPLYKFVQVDYDQLEVWALAILSGDPVLKNEILSGKDIHYNNARKFFGRKKITDKERKQIKAMTFQLQYGVSAKGLAKQWGMNISEAKAFIGMFYDKYKGVAKYHDHLIKYKGGSILGFDSTYRSVTGREYLFRDRPGYDCVMRAVKQERLNYPVQGFATADVVPIAIGEMMEYCNRNSGVRLINTVHDSIDFEIIESEIPKFCKEIKDIMEKRVTHILEEEFGLVIDIPLKVSFCVGDTFFDMKKLDV